MKKGSKIIIVGASFAGIKVAWDLRHKLGKNHSITLISDKPETIFRASFPHVIFEDQPLDDMTIDLTSNFEGTGISIVIDPLVNVFQEKNEINCVQGTHSYDYLIVATGARHAYEVLPGSREYAYSICDPSRIITTKEALLDFKGGIFYTGVGGGYTPCDGPQFEVIMNLDYRLRQLGVRHKAELHYITDKSHLLPPGGPKIWAHLEKLLHDHDISFSLDTELIKLDARTLYFKDGSAKPYDLCALIPPYRGIKALEGSGLTDDRGFIPIHESTMRATNSQNYNVYAIGDCAGLSGPKQGHLALMQANIAAEHVAWRINKTGLIRAYLPEFKCVMDLGGKQGLYLFSQWLSDGDIVEISQGQKEYESKKAFEKQFLAQKGDIGELHHQMMK